MSEIALLKVLFSERLSAVAAEIFDEVERTFVKYQEEVSRSYEEKYRLLQLYTVAHTDRGADPSLSLDPPQRIIPVSGQDRPQQDSRPPPHIQGEAFAARVKEEEIEGPLEPDPDQFIKLTLPCVTGELDHHGTPVLPHGFHSQDGGRSLAAANTTAQIIKTQPYGDRYETPEPACTTRAQAFCVVTVDSFGDEGSSGLLPEPPNPSKSKKAGEKKGQSADSEKTSKCKVETVSGETERRPHRCQECGKCFVQNSDLVAHVRQHRGEKPYECLECGKGFSTKVGQVMHVRRHTGEKPYKCKECGKSFVHNRYLSLHMRMHTGEKLYSCQQCGIFLNHKCRLIDHMRRHKGEKPFKCEECEKCFYRRGELALHMRIHTGEKPYECSVCGKQFSLHQSLTRHLRTHTGFSQGGSGS